MKIRMLVAVIVAVLLFVFPLALAAENSGAITATEDTYVNGIKPDMNFGGKPYLQVRHAGEVTTLIRFDLPTDMPIGVDRAYINLRLSNEAKEGRIRVRRVLTPWSESDVTYDTRPSTIPLYDVRVGMIAEDEALQFDVTEEVNRWLSDGTNYGLALSPININDDAASVLAYSTESDTGNGPVLYYSVLEEEVIVEFRDGTCSVPDPYKTMTVTATCGKYAGYCWSDDPGCDKYDWTVLGGGFEQRIDYVTGEEPICVAFRATGTAPVVPVESRSFETDSGQDVGWEVAFMNLSPCELGVEDYGDTRHCGDGLSVWATCRGVLRDEHK